MNVSMTSRARHRPGRRVAWWSVLVLVLAAVGMVGAPAASAAPGPAVRLSVSGPAWTTAVSAFQVKVVARDAAGAVATGFRGTVRFTSTDPRSPVLPAAYTFTAGDNGVHTFAGVQLHSSGNRTITATDTRTATIKGTTAAIRVSPGPVTQFLVSAPYQATAGVPFGMTVSAKDAWQNVVTGYRGTVRFTSNDPLVRVLPANYAFTSVDQGTHVFAGVTLVSDGNRTVVATDVAHSTLTGVDTVKVKNAGAALIGQVLANFDPQVNNATVTVYDIVTGLAVASVTIPDNWYTITGLPAGQYKIGATALGWLPGFADNRDTYASADVFTLAPGQTLGPDFPEGGYIDLDPDPSHSARIGGAVRSGDQLVPLATVTLYDATTGVVLRTADAPEGYYEFRFLPAGDYKLGATAPGFLPGFANDKDTFATADVLTLVDGQEMWESDEPFPSPPHLNLDPAT